MTANDEESDSEAWRTGDFAGTQHPHTAQKPMKQPKVSLEGGEVPCTTGYAPCTRQNVRMEGREVPYTGVKVPMEGGDARCTAGDVRCTGQDVHCTGQDVHCTAGEVCCTTGEVRCTGTNAHCTGANTHCYKRFYQIANLPGTLKPQMPRFSNVAAKPSGYLTVRMMLSCVYPKFTGFKAFYLYHRSSPA